MKHWSDKLTYSPCAEALTWLKTQPDAQTAWNESERGDWMLYHAGKLAGEPGSDARRPLVLAACECARLVLPHVKAGENRPLLAIETAERWARGETNAPTLQEVRHATYAADAAAAATYAAYAAADAADAADAAAAAAAATYAADAAAAAAAATYAAAAAAAATYAAYAATYAADAAAAAAAAYADAAAYAATYAATYAAYGATYAAADAADAADAAARAKALAICADIVRKHYQKVPT